MISNIFKVSQSKNPGKNEDQILVTPDQSEKQRQSRYNISYPIGGRCSTPIESTKLYSLDPFYYSPYQYNFSSNEAGWKLRMKDSTTTITPHENKSSISPIRLKNDMINIESIK